VRRLEADRQSDLLTRESASDEFCDGFHVASVTVRCMYCNGLSHPYL
jgi:hypothetical protein